MSASSARRVPCPRCRAQCLFDSSNRWRPFCSERCANIDLGAWASEGYRVEAEAPADPEGSETPPPPSH